MEWYKILKKKQVGLERENQVFAYVVFLGLKSIRHAKNWNVSKWQDKSKEKNTPEKKNRNFKQRVEEVHVVKTIPDKNYFVKQIVNTIVS